MAGEISKDEEEDQGGEIKLIDRVHAALDMHIRLNLVGTFFTGISF